MAYIRYLLISRDLACQRAVVHVELKSTKTHKFRSLLIILNSKQNRFGVDFFVVEIWLWGM